jgi:ATP-dependent DNA helicase RecQ
LLLLSAHRAKGLEFDHVFVLDGEWQPQGGEDADSVRRLYYVAMTRARQTLTLFQLVAGNFLIEQLPKGTALLQRPTTQWLPPPPGLNHRHVIPRLNEIDLGFAGRKKPGDLIHRRLAALRVGDELQLRADERGFRLVTGDNQAIGHLSRNFVAPDGLHCIRARVHAIVTWRRRDSDPEYQDRCLCDQWEVVLPELVFAP